MAKVNTPNVLVIGAGPADYTVTILLAERGWGVTWLEKYPPALPHRRVTAAIEHIDFATTRGTGHRGRHQHTQARRRLSNDADGYNTFCFAHALHARSDFAFQVPRAPFDQILFARPRTAGVDAHEEIRAEHVDFVDEQPLLHPRGPDEKYRFHP